jgi:DNA-binding MarR family transcriptional regulator
MPYTVAMADDPGPTGPSDAVDVILDAWRRERPELDPSAKAVTGRIIRLGSLFQQAYDDAFAELGLPAGHYGVLVALRRAGAPYERTPTDLARSRMMTSGGMTAALDRLERDGLVARRPNPADRRGSLVGLTAEGLALVEEAMTVHTATEHRLLAGLEADERDQLVTLLRKLLLSLEG